MSERKIRVRFAPSPTGALHIGGVRTALYNYLFAKQHGGDLVFRIEDTDSHRFVPGAEEYIIESFKWLGIHFDEGVSFGGNYGPYRQSERRDIYKKYVKQLLDKGQAYIAFDTPDELDTKRKEVANFQYDASTRMSMRNSLTLSKEEVDTMITDGKQYVVRFLIEPNQEICVNDLIRGDVKINSSILDDKVLYKSADELPTYHLANIVDDHLMEISHVIRGEEWLPSAPLHVLLYKAFGWESTMPEFAHLPLLLKPEGNGKLSKRDGDRLGFPVFPLEWHDPKTGEISKGYREEGYLPEALLNFLALLGWNPGDDREILSMDELVHLFNLSHCNRSGAKYDYHKCIWFNHQYIQKVSDEEVTDLFMGAVTGKGLSDLIRESFGVKITFYVMIALLLTNLGNTVSEFAGIAASMELFGISKYISVPLASVAVWLLIVKGSYRIVEKVFLVACIVYVAYPIAAFMSGPDWGVVLKAAVVPHFKVTPESVTMLIGLVGTTIAPWMQFYQQASVVEKGITKENYGFSRLDVIVGCVMETPPSSGRLTTSTVRSPISFSTLSSAVSTVRG